MIVGTLALLFLVPTLFIVFQTLQEKVKPAGNPSLWGGGIASLRYRFQNVHFARKCHYRTAGNPDSRMGGFTQ